MRTLSDINRGKAETKGYLHLLPVGSPDMGHHMHDPRAGINFGQYMLWYALQVDTYFTAPRVSISVILRIPCRGSGRLQSANCGGRSCSNFRMPFCGLAWFDTEGTHLPPCINIIISIGGILSSRDPWIAVLSSAAPPNRSLQVVVSSIETHAPVEW